MLPKSQVTDMDLPDFTDVLEESERILKECFTQYQIDEVFLSFNGGKDCTVLLDITLNVLREIYKRDDVAKELKVVYIRTNGPFSEIESFVEQIKDHYGVTLMVTEGELKTTLQRLLDQDERLKAGLMGTRRTDPYSENLSFMQKTDPSWPQIVRVSPLLNWSYHQIWSYTLHRRVPYCSLYDKGYTSIGSIQNTRPNPALAKKNSFGCISYLQAWHLSDATLERAGRGSTPKVAVNGHGNYNTINNHIGNGIDNNHLNNSDHVHPSCV
ncbi:FAD synthase-like [Helicoverpa zea]|uniref:FAD synthase-like n=1 Tax=Helicoverpa zea TaxID=7113 RepID=UPI001F59EEB3|nr:FAD synthase-like [Helicoverpa zea]